MNADGTGVTRLTEGANAAWSPDGTRIAFSDSSDVFVMNLDGTGRTRLTTDWHCDYQPAWSPDGSRIAFTSCRNTPFTDIWVMNADGTNQTQITNSFPYLSNNSPAYANSPAWCGDRIAFASIRDSTSTQIYTMNPDGSDITKVTNDATPDAEASVGPIAPRSCGRARARRTTTCTTNAGSTWDMTEGVITMTAAWVLWVDDPGSGSRGVIAFAHNVDLGWSNVEYTMNIDGTERPACGRTAEDALPLGRPMAAKSRSEHPRRQRGVVRN
jgi:Tol biopolymer transport system component